MVFIVGVDHLVQYNGPVPEHLRTEFRDFLVNFSRNHDISLIAEEFSFEALHDVYHASADTAMEAALTAGIEHRYCDLEERDMRTLGIPYFAEIVEQVKHEQAITEKFIMDDKLRKKVRQETIIRSKSYWHIREVFWYERIACSIDSNVLFICGHEHTDRFWSLLREKGHQCRVLEQYWRKDIFSDYSNINLH